MRRRRRKLPTTLPRNFPDSEVRVLLYKNAMRLYQSANNSEKTEAMGRKVLGLDGDDPEALVTVAEVIAERTRDTDLDKDQRYAEAVSMAQKVDADGGHRPERPCEHTAGENRRLQGGRAFAGVFDYRHH